MTTLAQTTLLAPVLRRLPTRLLSMLDAWSHRIAVRRAQQRREASRRRATVRARQRTGT